MNEILVVDKPQNCTSRDVVNFICKKFNTRKVGHTGTLDPMATGVLVILIGKYTNLVEVITAYDKVYEAEITLGILTDTLDSTGNVLKEEKVAVKTCEIKKVLKNMIGNYKQTVPIYSAVKVNGKKLYEYARSGEKVTLPIREVEIKSLEIISDIVKKDDKIIFKIKTKVSKGTYIRALINDIATNLNTVGIMSSLRRIKQGNIDISEANTINQIENDNYCFYDINKCLNEIYSVDVNEELFYKIKNGVQLQNIYNADIILFKYKNNNIAIYKNSNNVLKMWKYLL